MSTYTIKRGDTSKFDITVADKSGPVDLTEVQLHFTAKKTYDATALIDKTVGHGIVYTDAVAGLAVMEFTPADTEDLPSSRTTLVYDLELVNDADEVFTLSSGTINVEPDVATR
jgi:hypothetical protein